MKFRQSFLSLCLSVAVAALSVAVPDAAEAAGAKKARPAAGRVLKKAAAAKVGAVEKSRVSRTSLRRKVAVGAGAVAVAAVARPSYGEVFGLRDTPDALDLKSSVALVMDQDTSEVLFAKNSQAVLPIASLTKMMTGLVVVEARQPLHEVLEVTEDDIDTERNSSSRLAVGTQLSREEMLHLALMSSENRAAHALGRHYPGGLTAFVAAMNRKASQLGMNDTRYVDPTGLSSRNQSSASDLARLVKAAYQQPLLREFSTSTELAVSVGKRTLQYHNTNRLVQSPSWDIGLQKTGYIIEAGRCLVMQAQLAGRKLIMVFLDSTGKYSRLGDAERVRQWVESEAPRARALSGGVMQTSVRQ
ncbi:murein-DD-endopeptidase [Sphaerotilus hippei]|uniref:Murein-DD-endopeptidase n=1 Tax=Sphaerotilus hippei TaxID=744406 RepID=A0A318H4I0_9BURK|nr:D-alanyl-D-alanine endopeptidase [Sphaerotilus hippei]PXW98610.1 murein-DD-endopeptidase [Sphaerotilus hippei]